ncbi:hypothetical protein GCM10009720_29840 [Yaniella flava]|uniref:Lipoprotein n=1 Tax=Yaniella flava TaxID=287930 RepID=A0ABN2UZK0_9MICC
MLGCATLLCVFSLTGCAWASDETGAGHDVTAKDEAGASLDEVEQMDLKEQYQAAGKRYVQLNELYGELQTEISDDAWTDNGGRSEIVPGQGNSLGRAPEGATGDNSYFFTVSRWQATDQDVRAVVGEVAASWQERGWEVQEQGSEVHVDIRVTALTPDGYWFALEEDTNNQRFVLRGQSPVYWGPLDAIQEAIVERADAEDAASQETWDTTDRDDETGQADRQPGEHRPFPEWNALEHHSPAPTSESPQEWKTRDQ